MWCINTSPRSSAMTTTTTKESHMFDFILGVALGAAFAPFWMMVYKKGKELISSYLPPKQ